MSLANICEMVYVKFYQNLFIRLGYRDDTHRQTQRQTQRYTHRHTHRHPRFDPNIFSQNLTENKNIPIISIHDFAYQF